FHFKCSPLPITLLINRPVRERVLVPKLFRDTRESIAQRWSTRSLDKSSASFVRETFQRGCTLTPRRPGDLNRRHVHCIDTRANRERTLNCLVTRRLTECIHSI